MHGRSAQTEVIMLQLSDGGQHDRRDGCMVDRYRLSLLCFNSSDGGLHE